ncbi:MAG: DUF6150 family protein [Bacteroidota bacterium]|jgi:hypothetical protein
MKIRTNTHAILIPQLFLFICILLFNKASAQLVFSVNYASQADIKVFVVDYESQADLVVFKTKYRSEVSGNEGLWHFVEYASQSQKKIFFVKYASQADLLIFFTPNKSKAGWRKNEKKHLMY